MKYLLSASLICYEADSGLKYLRAKVRMARIRRAINLRTDMSLIVKGKPIFGAFNL